MNFKVSLGAAIAFAITVAALTLSITMTYSTNLYNEKMSALREREAANEKFAEIDREVRSHYYKSINNTVLMDSVAKGYLAGIGDPYAKYLSVEEYAKISQGLEGVTVGIGAELEISPDGYLRVIEVYPDSPAQMAGIEAGDLIISIDDVTLTPENSQQQLSMVEGAVGTRVVMTIRSGASERVEEMTRREIAKTTVYSRMIEDTNVGYILITEFSDRTSNQFNRELSKLQNAGARAIIFDVRDNKGGILRQATRILDRLIPAGSLVSAVYKDGSVVEMENSDGNWLDLPVVMLANKNTAGAAEVFVQVLKDYGQGNSVGTTTAGNGVVQEMVKLSDGSAIEITVAQYVTPSGEIFNGIGVKPDFEVTMSAELEGNWRNLNYETDPQLQKAVSVALSLVNAGEVQELQQNNAETEQDVEPPK